MKVKRINSTVDINSLYKMHKELSITTSLKNVLIYYDKNFIEYLRNDVNREDQYYYGLYDRNELVGFIHFKIFDRLLFLNNIFLNENVRGGGNGSFLIKEAIDDIKYDFEKISLDVFKSNDRVYRWYKKLNLKEVRTSEWLKLIKRQKESYDSEIKLVVLKDSNGFYGIFHNDSKVGTVINNEKVIVHNHLYINDISLLRFEMFICNVDYDLSPYESYKLEESIRMEGEFDIFYNKLNNV